MNNTLNQIKQNPLVKQPIYRRPLKLPSAVSDNQMNDNISIIPQNISTLANTLNTLDCHVPANIGNNQNLFATRKVGGLQDSIRAITVHFKNQMSKINDATSTSGDQLLYMSMTSILMFILFKIDNKLYQEVTNNNEISSEFTFFKFYTQSKMNEIALKEAETSANEMHSAAFNELIGGITQAIGSMGTSLSQYTQSNADKIRDVDPGCKLSDLSENTKVQAGELAVAIKAKIKVEVQDNKPSVDNFPKGIDFVVYPVRNNINQLCYKKIANGVESIDDIFLDDPKFNLLNIQVMATAKKDAEEYLSDPTTDKPDEMKAITHITCESLDNGDIVEINFSREEITKLRDDYNLTHKKIQLQLLIRILSKK